MGEGTGLGEQTNVLAEAQLVSHVQYAHVVELKGMLSELFAARDPRDIIGARRDTAPAHIVGEDDTSRPINRSSATVETSDRLELLPRWHEV